MLELYHYFSNPLIPFQNYMDEDLPDPEAYAEYAANVPGRRMLGYHAGYFRKRLRREAFLREIVKAKFGDSVRDYPLYTTLGREDARYCLGRNHSFFLKIPLPEDEDLPLLFCVGDSMCGSFSELKQRVFFYEDFQKLTYMQVQALLPAEDCDRIVEAQYWGDPGKIISLPSQNSPDYLHTLCVRMLGDTFGEERIPAGFSVADLKAEMRRRQMLDFFGGMIRSADVSFIPPGRIHGIPHSFRCAFLAFAMALEADFSPEKAAFAARCAAYHDVGRMLGGDAEHAEAARYAAEHLFPSDCAETAFKIMRCHCESGEFLEGFFSADEEETQRIAEIVHDADSLDYIRFAPQDGLAVYDPDRLIREASGRYIAVALELVLHSLTGTGWINRILE